jgi:GxxExxY protein
LEGGAKGIAPVYHRGTESTEKGKRRVDELTQQIIGAAMEVHKTLGPGLLESAYEECLCYELLQRGLHFKRQVPLPVSYKGLKLDCGYKMDIVVEGSVILELKSVEDLMPVHTAQLLTYLRLSGMQVGLLLNFNKPLLKDGIKRLRNDADESLCLCASVVEKGVN